MWALRVRQTLGRDILVLNGMQGLRMTHIALILENEQRACSQPGCTTVSCQLRNNSSGEPFPLIMCIPIVPAVIVVMVTFCAGFAVAILGIALLPLGVDDEHA